ncbi:MAG: hypothetical protein C4293_06075 [Nitrospiraceae bacterium]
MDKTICIDGLPFWVTDGHVREPCQAHGQIVSVRVVKDAYGTSLGYAFVEMATRQEAEDVVIRLDQNQAFGQPIYVARTYAVSSSCTVSSSDS